MLRSKTFDFIPILLWIFIVYDYLEEFFIYRYKVALKCLRMDGPGDVENFLDEVKSMLEISDYHENIVNLQGITFNRRNSEISESSPIGVSSNES